MQDWDNLYKTEGDIWKKQHKGDYLARPYPLIKSHMAMLKKNHVKKVLDVGCGTGRHAILLAREGFHVTAVDYSKAALEMLKEKAGDLPIEIKEADMADLPFPNESFDAIICINTIHHAKLAKIKKTISEMHRVLKKGGIALVDILSINNFRATDKIGKEIEPNTFINVGHYFKEFDVPHHFCTKEEALELFSSFEILDIGESNPQPDFKNLRWDLVLRKPQ